MSIVLDCSIVLAWYLPDEEEANATAALHYVTQNGGMVPFLFKTEIASGFIMAMRRNRIDSSFSNQAFEEIPMLQLNFDVEGLKEVWGLTSELADQYRLTIYDAIYLELAKRKRLPLATLDRSLKRAAIEAGVKLFDGASA